MQSDRFRTVWVDDSHAVLRRGMVATLSAEQFIIAGESSALAPRPPMDRVGILVFESNTGSLRAIRDQAHRNGVRLIATVRNPTDAHLHELAESGVAAIVLHADLTPEILIGAVRSVVEGRTSLPADVLPRLIGHAARTSSGAPGALSVREKQVLKMLADGQDTRGIALELCYSERTVKNVVHDVLTKLNCRTRAQAVGIATRTGVI